MANRQHLGWAPHTPYEDTDLTGEPIIAGPIGSSIELPEDPMDTQRERRAPTDDFDGFTVAVQNGSANMLFGEDSQRRLARVLNTSSTPILLGKKSRVTQGAGGFILPQNVPVEISTKQAVYANLQVDDHAAPATPVIVSVWIERD